MPTIRLKTLRFDETRFRKLGNLAVNLSERVTLIAGHNGIGKSTILGLSANGSGVNDATYKSYFNRVFVANLNDIVHLDYVREFDEPTQAGLPLPSPELLYEIDGEPLIKRCALTVRTERREVRVVSRNSPHAPWESVTGVQVGQDAKVPLPTIFLGMTRMLPIGESNPSAVISAPDDAFHADDAAYIRKFINDVIGTGAGTRITTQGIKGTRKTAKHPDYPYSAKCISLGQDSLSAIATALASFKRLKREWPDYPGGLLVIDEIDAGFHPHAQAQLAKAIKTAARQLQLQVLATTHSLIMIEAIHPEANPVGPGGTYADSVVYLTDTNQPRVADQYDLAAIRRDMALTPPAPPKKAPKKYLKVYLEDPEAALILDRILTKSLKTRVVKEVGISLKPIPISVGCGNLMGLMKHDPYFKSVLIAVDADATVKGKPSNVVKLPGAKDQKGKGRSPEWSLYMYIKALVEHPAQYPEAIQALAQKTLNTDYLKAHLLDGSVNIDNRESSKAWMTARRQYLEEWGIVDLWLRDNQAQVEKFSEDIVEAAKKTAPLV